MTRQQRMLARWPRAWHWALGGFGVGALGGLVFARVLSPEGPQQKFTEPRLAELSAHLGPTATQFLLCACAFGLAVGVPVALRLRGVLLSRVGR